MNRCVETAVQDRAVALSEGALHQWQSEALEELVRLSAGDWSAPEEWLDRWAGSAAARTGCARWAGRLLGMTEGGVLSLSPQLRGDCGDRLAMLCHADEREASAARFCALVLGWTRGEGRLRNPWPGLAVIAGPRPPVAFAIDARGDFRAGLEQGDELAMSGAAVLLRVMPQDWEQFFTGDSWDRISTRWREATVIASSDEGIKEYGECTSAAVAFVGATAGEEALPMLAEASSLLGEQEQQDAARSAAERLLFTLLNARRLTRGRFALNVPLPFFFGLRPAEADLAAPDARLVVEIDGYYHFRDPESYRRDRRKDALLQEHGWFVLRFLADDVVGDPGAVLARIEHVMARRDLAFQSDHA